jgi:hypothetical protein
MNRIVISNEKWIEEMIILLSFFFFFPVVSDFQLVAHNKDRESEETMSL